MNFTTEQLEAAVEGYRKGAEQQLIAYFQEHYKNLTPSTLEVVKGKRYYKVVRHDSQICVFAFIDSSNGNILKPASWNAPAKHARGNVFDDNFGLARTTVYGPEYLK